jgi:hypothetical protein
VEQETREVPHDRNLLIETEFPARVSRHDRANKNADGREIIERERECGILGFERHEQTTYHHHLPPAKREEQLQ